MPRPTMEPALGEPLHEAMIINVDTLPRATPWGPTPQPKNLVRLQPSLAREKILIRHLSQRRAVMVPHRHYPKDKPVMPPRFRAEVGEISALQTSATRISGNPLRLMAKLIKPIRKIVL